MGDLKIDLDVRNKDVADDIEESIEDGIENALKPSRPDSLGKKMERAMKEYLRQRGKVWTTELVNSFDIKFDVRHGIWVMLIQNDAEHAAPMDTGARYGAKGPPLAELIPWVQQKLRGYRVEGGQLVVYDDSPTIMTDGGTPSPPPSKEHVTLALPDNLETKEVKTFEEAGMPGGVNVDNSYYVEFENGDFAYFAENLSVGDFGSDPGTVKNEQLFTRISEELGWQLGPENKRGAIIDPQEGSLTQGNFQRWVDNSVDLQNEIYDGRFGSPSDYEYTASEFLDEHGEWLAKVQAVDAIVGNSDRHLANARLDENNVPHAIDNGGHHLPTGSAVQDRIDIGSILPPSKLENVSEFPELEAKLEDYFVQQRAFLREILENHSEAIIEHTKDVHGAKDPLVVRMEELLGADVDTVIKDVERAQSDLLDTLTGSNDMDPKQQYASTVNTLEAANDTPIDEIFDDLSDTVDELLKDIKDI